MERLKIFAMFWSRASVIALCIASFYLGRISSGSRWVDWIPIAAWLFNAAVSIWMERRQRRRLVEQEKQEQDLEQWRREVEASARAYGNAIAAAKIPPPSRFRGQSWPN